MLLLMEEGRMEVRDGIQTHRRLVVLIPQEIGALEAAGLRGLLQHGQRACAHLLVLEEDPKLNEWFFFNGHNV